MFTNNYFTYKSYQKLMAPPNVIILLQKLTINNFFKHPKKFANKSIIVLVEVHG